MASLDASSRWQSHRCTRTKRASSDVENGHMLDAISRYGPRVLPNTQQIISQCRSRGELICGPQIQEFEDRFSQLMGGGHSISASYGRMAFYYILKAMGLPAGAEIIFPALTFWVVPE